MLTPEQIIDMAVDSGLSYRLVLDTEPARLLSVSRLQKFAEQVVAAAETAEREACAQVAKSISDKYAFGCYGNEVDTADEIEAAIRARGEKKEAA